MNNRERIIKDFLTGSLTGEDKAEFMEYMKTDEEFRRMVLRLSEARSDLENIIDPGSEETEEKPEQATLNRRKIFIYAGMAVAALIVAGLILLSVLRNPGPERIYMKYYNPWVFETYRSNVPSFSNSKITSAYQDKDYARVRSLATGKSTGESLHPVENLMAGVSFMEISNFQAAIDFLSMVPESAEQYADAQWYLGLAHLGMGEAAESRVFFERAGESLVYVERCGEVLGM